MSKLNFNLFLGPLSAVPDNLINPVNKVLSYLANNFTV